jgi:alpha-D-ribose 1-methylphosphonate 5-triphosphate synthase subunit PhnH
MTLATTAFAGGFSNPVYDSQSIFHALMTGFARPGTVADVTIGIAQPEPMQTAQGAVALCLADHDTPVYLSEGLKSGSVAQWIAFHAGASVTDLPHDARFAFCASGDHLPDFADFAIGSQEFPDRSTTLVIEVTDFAGGPMLALTGPGIKTETIMSPQGLPDDFVEQWALNRALFPRGVDVVLTSGSQMLCLPRTTRLGRKEL